MWDPIEIGPQALKRLPQPFAPPEGYQLMYLSSADSAMHVIYLRDYQYYRVGVNSGRRKNEPREVQMKVALPEGLYRVEIWNLDTGGRTYARCTGQATLGLGCTNDDFALLFERR
ncbi:MAG: hypothetical protein ACP5G7_02345 [Anaerolineae bacterium]